MLKLINNVKGNQVPLEFSVSVKPIYDEYCTYSQSIVFTVFKFSLFVNEFCQTILVVEAWSPAAALVCNRGWNGRGRGELSMEKEGGRE